jgi:hypothetical protein
MAGDKKMLQSRFFPRGACRQRPCHERGNGESDCINALSEAMKVALLMMNSNTRHTGPGDYKAADVSDEYVWSEISYLDPEQQNEPSNVLLWVTTGAALLLWGLLWFLFHSL